MKMKELHQKNILLYLNLVQRSSVFQLLVLNFIYGNGHSKERVLFLENKTL